MSQDCRATVARLSYDVRASDATLSPRNYGELNLRKFPDTRTNVIGMSHDSRSTVLRNLANNSRLSGEKIKLSDIPMNVVSHSYECLATVVRMKMKLKLHSWDRRETLSRMSRNCRTTVARPDDRATVAKYIFKIRLRFATLSHKIPFNTTAT